MGRRCCGTLDEFRIYCYVPLSFHGRCCFSYIPHVEITTLNTMQSIEAPWPQVDRLQVFSNVNYERGTGGGMLGVDISKTISESVVTDVGFFPDL